jgi:hypothetical protein
MKNESSKNQPKEANTPKAVPEPAPVTVPKPDPAPVTNTVPKTNGIAVASMVVGILSLFFSWIPIIGLIGFIGGIVAIILGIIALKKSAGKGLSIAGIVTGAISVISSLVIALLAFNFFLLLSSAVVEESKNATTDTSISVQKSFKVGDVINIDGKKVTVTSVTRNWNSGNEYIVPESGYEFVKVQVAIENDSSNQISYNTYDWEIQDSKGVIKDVAFVTYSVDGTLESGELAPNGKVAGFIIFEVPIGDTELVLQYNPLFWTDKKIEIKL